MVGIRGGVPSEEADIRLGDVVVGRPHNEHSGVVQYDSGKATPTGFKRTGFLNAPPTILLNAIANLRANHIIGRCRLVECFSTLDCLPAFAREDAGQDILFEAEYNQQPQNVIGSVHKGHRQDDLQDAVMYITLHYPPEYLVRFHLHTKWTEMRDNPSSRQSPVTYGPPHHPCYGPFQSPPMTVGLSGHYFRRLPDLLVLRFWR